MSRTLAARLDSLIALHDGQPVVVCGGNPHGGTTEAEVMADYLARAGVSPVIQETKSRTTIENVDFLREVLASPPLVGLGLHRGHHDPHRLVIVTSHTHTLRTRAILASRGLPARVIGSPQPWLKVPRDVIREIGAFIVWAFQR